MVTIKDIESFNDFCISIAKRQLKENNGLVPVFFLLTDDKAVNIIMAPNGMENQETKDGLAKSIKQFNDKNVDVVAMVFASEAWALNLSKEERESLDHFPVPSESKDRVEVLQFIMETKLSTKMETYKIIRDRDKIIDVEILISRDKSGEIKGRFTHLLNDYEQNKN